MAKRKRLDPTRIDTIAPAPADPGPLTSRPRAAAPIAGVAGDAAAAAAAAELADTLSRARATGRMVIDLPLDQIDPAHLVRDRVTVDEDEMATLVASLKSRGQQTPVEVVDLGPHADPRYGLISGWRRLRALDRIARENGDTATVSALLRQPDDAGDAYLAMVEENEIRVDLSYYERARIALKAVEQGAFPDTKAALLTLFHAASRAKRSKIRSFLAVVSALDGTLRFPEAMGERMGLRLSKALEADPGLAGRLRAALDGTQIDVPEVEQSVIIDVLGGKDPNGVPKGRRYRLPVRRGLDLTKFEDGAVHLSGPAIDEEFRRAILTWLEKPR